MSLAAGLLARHIRRRIGRGRWVRPGCRSSRGRARIRGVAERRRILQVGLGHVQHGTIRVAPADDNRSAILLYNASSRVGRRAGWGRDRRNRVGRGRAWQVDLAAVLGSVVHSSALNGTATSFSPIPRNPPTPITIASAAPSRLSSTSRTSPILALSVPKTSTPTSFEARHWPGDCWVRNWLGLGGVGLVVAPVWAKAEAAANSAAEVKRASFVMARS